MFAARREIGRIQVSDAIKRYMADLVYATRTPAKYSEDLDRWIDVGSSPRASLALDRCSRTHAWLEQRDYVDPEDVRAIVHDVMRHRLMLSYEAQGEGIKPDQVIDAVVEQVALMSCSCSELRSRQAGDAVRATVRLIVSGNQGTNVPGSWRCGNSSNVALNCATLVIIGTNQQAYSAIHWL